MCCLRMIFDFIRPEKDNQAHAGRTNDDYFDLSSMKNVTVNLKETDEHLLSPDSGITSTKLSLNTQDHKKCC